MGKGTSYTVTNFGEYLDVIENGEVLQSTGTVTESGIVNVYIYAFEGRIYSLSTLDKDQRVYMIRLS